LISIELAANHRRHVSALIANGAPGWTRESQRMARLATVSALTDADGLPRPGIVPGGTTRPASDSEVAERIEDFQKTGRWFMSTMWAIASFDPIARLPKIACPTLILMGRADYHMPTSYNLADGIDDARLVVIEGAGHLTPYDDPDGVLSAIVAFLDDTCTDRAAQ
jgi:pimeloyl-ACP methyl ester carboxylesterase